MRDRQTKGHPIPGWLRQHFDQLDQQVRVSRLGQESDCGAGQLAQDKFITAQKAARIIGCSKRPAQRIATDLDGELVGGRWLFRLSAVEEYAEERRTRDG